MNRQHKQRLLYVITSPLSLGFLRGQLRFMREKGGFEVHLACSPSPALMEFAREEGVVPHPLPMARRPSPVADAVSLSRLIALTAKVRPDVVHASTPKAGLLGTLAAALCGVPKRFYQVRGMPLETTTGAKRRILLRLERVACLAATDVLANSSSLRSEMVGLGICDEDRVSVLGSGSGNGVDIVRFDREARPATLREETRIALHVPANAQVLLFVGRLTKDKGIGDLASAWDMVKERRAASDPSLHLLLVGDYEQADPVPRGVRERLQHDSCVHHLSFCADVRPYYVAADLLVFPSHREGFPNVPLEAAAMALPAVGFDVTGTRDAIVDGETGWLVPRGDVKQLARAVERALSEPDALSEAGERAKKRARGSFDQKQLWTALLRRFVDRPGAPVARS